MRLGLVLECATGGPDDLVLTCLARRLVPGIEVKAICLGNKPSIFLQGIDAAVGLVENSKCDLVMVVWDLKPYWEKTSNKSCQAEVALLREQLERQQNHIQDKIKLLCITWELETWLIADPRCINAHLSTPTYKTRFSCRQIERKTDPKAYLHSWFQKHGRRSVGYNDFKEAIKIAREIPDTHRIRRIPSCRRFMALLTNDLTPEFKQSSNVCKDLGYQAKRMGR